MTVPAPAAAFLDGLADLGIRVVSSVPCTFFSGPLGLLDSGYAGMRHIAAVNEGSATAIAAGSTLAGETAAVLAQNSGFGHLANPLTSLVLPYRIPLLVVMSMRGWPSAGPGQEQHAVMGQVVPAWLDALGIPHWFLAGEGTGADGQSLEEALKGAAQALADRKAAFILVPKGAIGGASGTVPERARRTGPTRGDVVRALLAEVTDQHIVSTTGYMCRELFTQGDRPGNFYMQGSMGHASGIALGSALARPGERFVVLDGDGAALMHMGVLATIGHFAPANLTHVVFDNGGYESTGSQPTAASVTDLRSVAEACGYRSARSVTSAGDIGPALRAALREPGPALVVIHGGDEPVTGALPSEQIPAPDIATRFSASIPGRSG